jgi:hypothetical protein
VDGISFEKEREDNNSDIVRDKTIIEDSKHKDVSVNLQDLNQMDRKELINKLKNMSINDLQELIPLEYL